MIRRIIAAGLGMTLTLSLVWLGILSGQEKAAVTDNAKAAQLAGALEAPDTSAADKAEPDGAAQTNAHTDPEADRLGAMDIDALQKINPDVIGWIHIPDTDIDYPLLHGDDNEHYLKHTWNNVLNPAGAIFMEHENAADMSDFNTIIYGHNMRSGSMFGSLKKYAEQAYWEAHPHIYIRCDSGVYRYDIFAAYKVRPATITYAMRIDPPQMREEFISCALDGSQIQTGIRPKQEDKLLTLSTCIGDPAFRWVVQAVLNDGQA